MRFLLPASLVLTFAFPSLAQVPQPPPARPPSASDEKPAGPQPILDSPSEAAKLLREKAPGFADKEPRARAEALEAFVTHRHESYVKPILPLLKDKDPEVAKAAARALGNQPYPASSDALLAFGTNQKNFQGDPEVAAEAIRALGTAGLGKRGYERLREIWDDADKNVKKAIVQALAAQKEKKAFSLFVDNCDEPRPENPNSASNPPAAYWKARFEEWDAYKTDLRRGLKEMTGVALASKKQYVEWAEGPGKKLGFVYERGG